MYVQVLIGFDVLSFGAEVIVRKAVDLPGCARFSPMVICMTVFAVGLWQLNLIQTVDIQQVIG